MNERKATVALLSVIAVLLALNLVVKGTGEVEAQVRGADGEPYVVKWLPHAARHYVRVWSDGQMDYFGRPNGGDCETWGFAGVLAPAVDHPFPVIDARAAREEGQGRAAYTLEFADGRVDFINLITGDTTRCTIASQGSDAFCIGDTDRSGVTDFQDIVNVLEDWGECE